MARVPGFVKWVVAPLLAGALGFVVAPMFRGKVPLPKFVEKAASLARPRSEAAPKEAAPQAPNVKVDVKPVPDEDRPRRRSDASDTPRSVVLPRGSVALEA